MRVVWASFIASVALFGAARGDAQASVTMRSVRGTVFDSVANTPLVGATVQVASRAGTTAPRTATTDAHGAYRIDSLPPGAYLVGFYHDALTALGLDAPTQALTVTAGDVVADLAVPSSETIRTVRCGVSSPYAPGMLVGSVRDASTGHAVAQAKVTVEWRAFAVDSGQYRVVREMRTGSIENGGILLVCHLPLTVPLDLVVTAPGHRAVSGAVVDIPQQGIGKFDVLLVDSGVIAGTGIIRGRVKRENGKPVASGRAMLASLNREATVRDGEFTLANIPPGSWVVRTSVIGVEPKDMIVTASDSAVVVASVVLPNASQRMDAVTVIGKRDHRLDVLDDVLRRSRIGMGTVFLPGHPALRSAVRIGEIMKEARGFRFIRPDSILGRLGCRYVTVFVDDMQLPDGFARIDQFVDPKDVLAVETWPDITVAPVRFRYGFGFPGPMGTSIRPCAVVAVWTRRPF